MNRDLILGAAASLVIHAGALFGNLFHDVRMPLAKTIVLVDPGFVLPVIEPDDPEKPRDEPDEPKLTFVPPQQIDVPAAVTEGAITQVLQPPPPDSTRLSSGAIETIDRQAIGRPTGRIFEAKLLDQIPQPRFRTPPVYPFEMRRTGIEGEVMVDFLVDTEGNVLNARAATSSHREFELSAVQAVAKWKFRPGRKDGQSVITHMQVPIVFTLEN